MLTLAASTAFLAQAFPTGLVTLAVVFFIIAIVAYLFGANGVAGLTAGVGRTLLVIFAVLAVIILVIGFMNRAV